MITKVELFLNTSQLSRLVPLLAVFDQENNAPSNPSTLHTDNAVSEDPAPTKEPETKKPRAKKQVTEASQPEPVKGENKPSGEVREEPVTLESLRAFLTELSVTHKKSAQVKGLIKQYGADNLAGVHENDYALLLADAKRLLA